jgi:hypothetical protein
MSMRKLCLAGAITLGLGSAAAAQSLGVETPFGGVGVYGPDRYAYSRDAYWGDHHRGPGIGVGVGPVRAGVGAYAYDDAYAYDQTYGYDQTYAYEPGFAPRSNLRTANPHANPDIRPGWTEAERDQYRSIMGYNSN